MNKERGKISDQINRLENGLGIMQNVTEKVDDLKKLLEVKMVDVAHEKEKTQLLIDKVQKENEDAQEDKDKAAAQQKEVEEITAAANAEKENADVELAKAEPAMLAAAEAVNCLEVQSITMLKSLPTPPEACVYVAKACLILK